MAKLRTCKICGKQYEYCGHCPSKNVIEPWRNLYCSENCREAFKVMGDYSVKKISALEAKGNLSRLGIFPKDVRDIHKAVVGEIYKAKDPVEAPVIEVSLNVEKIPMVEETPAVEEIPMAEGTSSIVIDKPVFHKNFKKKKQENIVNDN